MLFAKLSANDGKQKKLMKLPSTLLIRKQKTSTVQRFSYYSRSTYLIENCFQPYFRPTPQSPQADPSPQVGSLVYPTGRITSNTLLAPRL